MVNINCTSNCIHQIDGKCTLSNICPTNNLKDGINNYSNITINKCIYYSTPNMSK